MPPVIQAVIFDFGNVLCFPPSEEKINQAATTCGVSPDQFLAAFWLRRLDYDAGLLEPADYWQSVSAAGDFHFDPVQLPALVAHEIAFWNHYDHRVFDWIGTLRSNGVRTGILSNLPRVLGEALRAEVGFLDHFDHVTFSYELKSAKPDAPIYRHAYQGLSLAPEQTLFLDDKQPNVDGAIALGMNAELFTTWDDLLKREIPQKYGLPSPA